MVMANNPAGNRSPSRWCIGSAIRVAGAGTVLVALYFLLVTESPIRDLRESLRWMFFTGTILWVVAVALCAAGVSLREDAAEAGSTLSGVSQPPATRATTILLRLKKRFPNRFRLQWTLPLLYSLSFPTLGHLAACYFREIGFRPVFVESPPNRIDLILNDGTQTRPAGLVRCLAERGEVGPAAVRELLQEAHDLEIGNAVLLAPGTFSADAVTLAMSKPLELISGEDLLAKFAALPEERSRRLLLLALRAG
jgi:hypothetical protein